MTVSGPITWFGYVIRCSTCGADADWRLSVHPDADPGHVPAEDADLTCPGGHTQRHPLVYPEMVRMLFAAAPGGNPTDRDGAAAMAAIDWRPHARVVHLRKVKYVPWEYEPGPDEAQWPDLCWVYTGGVLPRPTGR